MMPLIRQLQGKSEVFQKDVSQTAANVPSSESRSSRN
jgi:hypothetical protein